MKFKIFLFIFVSAFLINDVLSRKFSFGKISRGFSRGSSHAGSSGRISSGSSRGGYSHGVSSSGTSHGTSLGKSSANVGLKPSGSGSIQQNKNINTNFLNAEGGGATRPKIPVQPSYAPSAPPMGGKPGVITESKQTSGIPSAPQDHIMKTSTGTLQNSGTGHASPPWSNPYLGTNIPAVPAQSYPPRSNPHLGINKPNTQPTMQGAEAPSNPNGASTSSVPQAQGSVNNQPSGATNAGETNRPSSGNANSYTPRSHSSDASSSSSAGSDRSTATPVTGLNAANDQNSTPNNLLYRISDDELYRISEELFAKNSHNISKYIKLNLQTRVTSPNVTDKANEQLFNVDLELFQYPSIYVIRSLYDNYEHDFLKKLNRTLETRKQENLLIDTFLNTNEMSTTMQWLADRGFIDPDDFERKDVLRRIWFTIFSGSTCGFERVFASENYGTAIVGVQDWIYFAHQESLKRIDYMGYVDKLNFGTTASLLKLNFQMDGIIRPNATIFVGTLPELEMSLYTICFYARPNDLCPVSLGGTKFNIYTHSFTYFGSQTIDLALPMF
ncbi:unnamed protein product [Xylocopa violacea]|uniref:EndoU domain-containing protein n=1 Tax=Xylocopa violacea TaxID=135666 RepID=A0ABP1NTT4_XYLVO